MITVRAGSGAIGVCLLLLMAGCSREQQDWRSAEAADTIEGYGQFIQRHPESELATQARTRVAQLGEDRDWQHAGSADTVAAYREFIAQHPNGKWAQEAHIRIENFSLGEQAGMDAGSKAASGAGPSAGVGPSPSASPGGARSYGLASPGEAASPPAHTPAGSANATADASSQGPGSGSSLAGASPTPSHPAVPSSAATAPQPLSSGASSSPRSATSAGKGTFGIQLGAFSTEASANTEWRLLASRYAPDLQGLQEHVVPVDTASGRIYRLQAAVGDEGRARSICNSLRNHGQACVAVLPH